jgi:cysteine synthase
MFAAMRLAERAKAAGQDDAVVVTVLADSAAKYLSESFWTDSEAENWP